MIGVRAIRRPMRLLVAGIAMLAIAVLGVSSPAWAADFPSWQDVENAKKNEASKQTEIARIEGLIAAQQARVAETQAIAEQRGQEYRAAQDAFDAADLAARALQDQADASSAAADAAMARAGLLAAQLYRSGGSAELSAGLFLEGGGGANSLLAKLGQASKLAEINDGVYAGAVAAGNVARSLTDQAEVARDEREKLRIEAEALMAEAVAANDEAQALLAEQESQNLVLEQQLAALRDATATTIAEYERGTAAKAAAAARRGPSGPRDGGQLSSQGWAVPVTGWISSSFGFRPGQPAGASLNHRGTDLAAPCGTPIYAATAGTVRYAGVSGTYGNWILIDNGDGVSTGYAHILDGGIFVNVGDQVTAGQNIAAVGTSGASTGCHLHFELRIDGSATDAEPFMAARGATLG